MLSNLKNMNGVTVLGKKEQREVRGGDKCYLYIDYEDGTYGGIVLYTSLENGSSTANDRCVDLRLNGGASRCQYDCAHDGFGQ